MSENKNLYAVIVTRGGDEKICTYPIERDNGVIQYHSLVLGSETYNNNVDVFKRMVQEVATTQGVSVVLRRLVADKDLHTFEPEKKGQDDEH